MVVDEDEARICKKLRASSLIVLVESKTKHELNIQQKNDFLTIFKKEISRKMIVSLLAI